VSVLEERSQQTGVDHGPEDFEWLDKLLTEFWRSLEDLTIVIDNRVIRVWFANVADMSCRNTIYSIGDPKSDWPLITLPQKTI